MFNLSSSIPRRNTNEKREEVFAPWLGPSLQGPVFFGPHHFQPLEHPKKRSESVRKVIEIPLKW